MENIINIRAFVDQLSTYFKICILANKGTRHDVMLERTIQLCNKIQKIAGIDQITSEDELFIRKTLKRFNLVLKLDGNNNPVNLKDKENQYKLLSLREHSSLCNNNMNDMLAHISQHKICTFPNITLSFFLTENKYSELLWDHTRLIFYMTQFLLAKNHNSDPEKEQVFTIASKFIEETLTVIADKEAENNINKMMSLDNFLNNKIVKSGINANNVGDATKEVKGIFSKKGLDGNNSMFKMIDLIGQKLESEDLTGGNIMQTMLGIAQNVAEELRGDLENDPAAFQSAIGAITEVFEDTMNNTTNENGEVPPEIKGMMGSLLNLKKQEQNGPEKDKAMADHLKQCANVSSLNTNDTGAIDPMLIQNFLQKNSKK
uniref:Uncharacterized protein n=1 Tax=viral metagenome TaxID=1070528 RepID=A0A6C0C908_9ZZZZ